MIWIALASIALFTVTVLLFACKAASLADQRMEAAFADWMSRHPDKE